MLGFIVEIIGEEATAKLIARFGGTRLYVPHSPCADDPLARAVGAGAAMKLARMFGGERVEVPKPPPRRTQILALRAGARAVRAPAARGGADLLRPGATLAAPRRFAPPNVLWSKMRPRDCGRMPARIVSEFKWKTGRQFRLNVSSRGLWPGRRSR